jgi:hypothetical protein
MTTSTTPIGDAVVRAIDADNASKKKRLAVPKTSAPVIGFSCALYAFTAIDNDYGPPFIDTVITDNFADGLVKLNAVVDRFYQNEAEGKGREHVKIRTFDWADVDAQITRKGYFETDEQGFQVFVKRFSLKQESRHFIE